jgi:hypothetical protein
MNLENHFRPVIQKLVGNSIAPNTLQIYQRGIFLFDQFRSGFGLKKYLANPIGRCDDLPHSLICKQWSKMKV